MATKPFHPQLVNPDAELLHDQYGITEIRVNQLADKITDLCQEMEVREEIEMSWAFDQLARFTDTPQEYTFAVMTITLALANHLRA